MARITWNDVAVPNLDIRGLAMSADGLGRAFDNIAGVFQKRYDTQRKTATDEALAKGLSLSGAELDSYIASNPGAGNALIDQVSLMQGLRSEQKDGLTREGMKQDNTIKNESILDMQGANAIAPLAMKLHDLQYNGKTEEYEGMISELASQDPLVARGVRQMADKLMAAREAGVDDRREQTSDDRTHSRGMAQIGIQQQQVDLARRQDNREQTEFDRATAAYNRSEQERIDTLVGTQVGRGYLDRTPAGNSQDAAALLVKTPTYLAASPAKQRAMLAGVTGRDTELYGENSNTTEDRLALGGINATLGATQGNARMVDTIATNQLMRNNPGAEILKAAQDKKYDGVNNETARKAYRERTGIMGSDQFYEDIQTKYGFTDREMMAALDNIDMTDRGFSIPFTGPKESAMFGGWYDNHSGTVRAKAAFEAMADLQKQGELAKTQASLDTDASRARNAVLSAEATRLAEQARRERRRDGDVSAQTKARIQAVDKAMQDLLAKSRKASGAD